MTLIITPGMMESSVRGVFATGDVSDKRYRYSVTRTESGCMAALGEVMEVEEGAEDD